MKWSAVQHRHLFSMFQAYRLDPKKPWYFFADDDTFVLPTTLPDILGSFDSETPQILGHLYLSYSCRKHLPEKKKYYVFAQGGAGIVVSHGLMKEFGPYIMNCSISHQEYHFASDMRLAVCIENFYHDKPNLRSKIFKDLSNLNGMELENKPRKPNNSNPYSSFHKITKEEAFLQIYNAAYSIWKDKNGKELFMDWSYMAGTLVNIPYDNNNHVVECNFGMNFRFFNYFNLTQHLGHPEVINATSQFEPVFDEEKDPLHQNPRSFVQFYQNGYKLSLFCKENLTHGEFLLDTFTMEPVFGARYFVNCPKPQEFLVNHPGKYSPEDLVYDTFEY